MISSNSYEEFKEYLQAEEKSEATVEKYMRDVERFLRYIGDGDMTRQRVVSYKNSIGGSYAPTSANSMIAALNCFLRFCGLHSLCVKQFKLQRQAFCAEERELSREEYLRLLAAASGKNDQRLCLIMQTICGTGIRVSELEYITVDAARRGETTVNCKGKQRRIFIVPKLRKKLLAYAKERGLASGAVFVTRTGRPISRHNIWKEMKALCEEANVLPSKVFPHNLRHLFARTFYHIEKDIAKLADILGHSNINTTRIYTSTTGAEHRRKMELMRLII